MKHWKRWALLLVALLVMCLGEGLRRAAVTPEQVILAHGLRFLAGAFAVIVIMPVFDGWFSRPPSRRGGGDTPD